MSDIPSDKTSVNDITGDRIKTKNPNKKFEDNYQDIDWSIKWEPGKDKKDDDNN